MRRSCEKLSHAVGQKQQGRLDGFFSYVLHANVTNISPSIQPKQQAPSASTSTSAKLRLIQPMKSHLVGVNSGTVVNLRAVDALSETFVII